MLSGVVFCCLVASCLAAQAIGPLPEKPEKFKDVEGCYIEELDRVIPFGSDVPALRSCMEFRCSKTNIIYTSCGSVGAGEGVKIVEDKGKPYPACCPRLVPIDS